MPLSTNLLALSGLIGSTVVLAMRKLMIAKTTIAIAEKIMLLMMIGRNSEPTGTAKIVNGINLIAATNIKNNNAGGILSSKNFNFVPNKQ